MPTATVTGLTPGQPYDFQVYAYNAAGNGNPTSPPLTVTTTAPPAPPPPAPPPPAPAGAVQWESFSLVWDPPSYKPLQWIEGGEFVGEAGMHGVGAVPTAYPIAARTDAASDTQGDLHAPMRWTTLGEIDAAAIIGGNAEARRPMAARDDATTSISGRISPVLVASARANAGAGVGGGIAINLAAGAVESASVSVSGDALGVHPAAPAWTVAGQVNAAAGAVSGIPRINGVVAGTLAAAASTPGNAVIPNRWLVAGTMVAAAGAQADWWDSHGWSVAGTTAPTAGMQANAIVRSFFLAGTLGASAGSLGAAIKQSPGVSYPVMGQLLPVASIIPFGGNAPLRVSNYIVNPAGYGSVAGSPGTLPYPWDAWSDDLTRTIGANGTTSQIPYTTWRFNGTAPNDGGATIQFGNPLSAKGFTWSIGAFIRLSAGSLAHVWGVGFEITSATADGATILTVNTQQNQFIPTSAALNTQWFEYDGILLNDTNMGSLSVLLHVYYQAGAQDFTLQIGAPRLERASTVHGSQYIVVPAAAFIPDQGDATTYVY